MPQEKSIKIRTIEIIAISFFFGIFSTIIIYNIIDREILEFSTLGIIGFVLSIIFGGASLVLAIIAINLSKISEYEIVRRNSEGIEAQNKTLQKTMDVLSEIKTSTGVTEKRIEDVISGRTGPVFDDISSGKIKDRYEFEQELKKSLSKELSPEELGEIKKEEEARKKYEAYHGKILSDIQDSGNVDILKRISHGGNSKKGLEIFDTVLLINNKKIALSVYSNLPEIQSIFISGFEEFIPKVALSMSLNMIDYFFYIGEEKGDTSHKLKEELENLDKVVVKDYLEKMFIIYGNKMSLLQEIQKRIS